MRPDVKAMSKAAERYRDSLADTLRTVDSARREGMIAGLEMALAMAIAAHNAYGDPIDDIRAEIERLKA